MPTHILHAVSAVSVLPAIVSAFQGRLVPYPLDVLLIVTGDGDQNPYQTATLETCHVNRNERLAVKVLGQ